MTNNTYVRLDDVIKIISNTNYADNSWVLRWIKQDIKYLDFINPIQEIDTIIEENRDEVYMEWKEKSYTAMEYKILQELKQRLTK